MFDPVTFTKNGATKVAKTPRQAVQLRFDGWREAPADTAETPEQDPADQPSTPPVDVPLQTTDVETPDTV